MSSSRFLSKNNEFVLRAAFAAFGVYFCMYAFRKPFTVATFENISYLGIDYKILLIIAQVFGYFISKFLGIKIISEMKSNLRLKYLLGFILMAELSLLGFAVVPKPYNILFMFLNGLPLGMIWGIVFSYLEGRKSTELLGLILCSSFVVSSGFVKTVGKFTMDSLGINEFWMPFCTGLFFLIPLLFFGLQLEKLPPPNAEDMAQKTKRLPLNKKERSKLLQKFFYPLLFLTFFYVILTVLRDFRDNFTREIWDSLGYKNNAVLYTLSEIPIAIIVLTVFSFLGTMKNNSKAFLYYHYALFAGILIIGLSTLFFRLLLIGPVLWMVLSGLGMYLCYIPFNGIYFDRMIATFKIKGNVGFLIYFVDSFGYLGSALVLLYKNFGQKNSSWLQFYINLNYIIVFFGFTAVTITLLFFKKSTTQINLRYENQI